MGSPLHCSLSCPHVYYLEVVGCLLTYTLGCPLSSNIEVVGSLILIAKFQWTTHSVAHVHPMGSKGGGGLLPCFFRMGIINTCYVPDRFAQGLYRNGGSTHGHHLYGAGVVMETATVYPEIQVMVDSV